MTKHTIKNPTARKARNRGFTPVSYHHASGVHNGWIYKFGTKWNHAFFHHLETCESASLICDTSKSYR